MALSPWPATTSAAARTAAVARLRDAVGGRTYLRPEVIPGIARLSAIPAANRTADEIAQLAKYEAERDAADAATNSLGETASALVEQYAPSAPQAIKDEATIRAGGYLAQSDFGGIASENSVGSAQVEYVTNHAAMFRNSGAAALLTGWRIRRAGSIG